jgi:hypothetical protein
MISMNFMAFAPSSFPVAASRNGPPSWVGRSRRRDFDVASPPGWPFAQNLHCRPYQPLDDAGAAERRLFVNCPIDSTAIDAEIARLVTEVPQHDLAQRWSFFQRSG